jgi:L-asparaginase
MTGSEAICVLTTGGTIDKVYFDALSEFQVGASAVPRLLEIARVRHPFRVEEVLRKDSLDLTDADRAKIRERVAAAPEHRIVITHGTDTMTHTACALAEIGWEKTIVLVGALAPARFQESDAAFNLGMAIATAQIASPGIYITMNGTVFDGLKVMKDRKARVFIAA